MTNSEYCTKVAEASEFIRSQIPDIPKICLVLGSGLGPLTDRVETIVEIPYEKIPHFPATTVAGHDGKLLLAVLSGRMCFIMKGRFHYYEGYSTQEATFYVRVMAKLGVEILVMTNAAGGINTDMTPSDLMVITDHIGLFCDSPLRGGNLDEFGPRFPDQTRVYDEGLKDTLLAAAEELNIPLHQGVYAYTRGPQYETPAEISALRILGADAVGMSTVAEAIAASHCGMKILAVSCITNYAAGITGQPLSHAEVMENANKSSNNSIALMERFFSKL
ncbi:MAG: purine-nucleoside phosphorylase [Clostridiales bacterium]|nr:purine-nucleoside phosphorylase [Clostridiales bacterium]